MPNFRNQSPLMRSALLVLLWACSLPAWSAAGIIQLVLGEAHVSNASGLERPAQKGVQLYDGDTVWTRKRANVQIRMIDDAMIWVYPETRLKIRAYDKTEGKGFKGEHAVLELLNGGLRTVTGSIKQDYAMTTPNAVIGIRGTDYTVVFIGAGAGQDTRGEPGTYNRVFQGATFMQSGQTGIDIAQGQSGFAALQPGTPPRILQTIPNFLNGAPTSPTPPVAAPAPAAAPASAPAPAPAPAPAAAPPPPPRQLLVTVRFGEPPGGFGSVTSSSREASNESQEQSIQVLDGQRASISTNEGTPASARAMPGITGVPGLSGSQLEVQPSLSGNLAVVSFYSQMLLSSPGRTGPAQLQQVATTLSLPLGEWTEVSGRGPWASSQASETTSSRSSRQDIRRIFLKVDDITR